MILCQLVLAVSIPLHSKITKKWCSNFLSNSYMVSSFNLLNYIFPFQFIEIIGHLLLYTYKAKNRIWYMDILQNDYHTGSECPSLHIVTKTFYCMWTFRIYSATFKDAIQYFQSHQAVHCIPKLIYLVTESLLFLTSLTHFPPWNIPLVTTNLFFVSMSLFG